MIREKILQSIYDYRKSQKWHRTSEFPYDIHASETRDCLRKLYFKRTVKLPPTRTLDRTLLLYETGNVYHRAVQALFPEAEIEKEITIKLKGFRIIGRADLVHNGTIYELKAVSTLPSLPFERTEYQVECYMRGLRKQSAVVVYIKKSTFESVEFEVKRDDLRWVDIKTRARKLVRAYDEKNIPQGEFTSQCRWCPYYSQCRKLKYY